MLSLILSLLIINASPDAGTAGFNFLKITPSAKEASMANATIGLETNSSLSAFGFWYNPAAGVEKAVIGAGYLNYLAGISYGVIGYSKKAPFSFLKSGGIGISFLNSGPIKRTDINGNELGTFSVSYLNLDIAGNISLTSGLDAGLGLKILYGSIDSFFGLGLATDLGLRFKPDIKGLTLGAVVRNLGYQVKAFNKERDKLPSEIGIGAGYNLNNNTNIALDIRAFDFRNDTIYIRNDTIYLFKGLKGWIDKHASFRINFGIEGWINKFVALRGGYNSLGKDYKTGGTTDITSGLSVGLGVKYSRYQVDYSFTPMGNLGRLHHITLLFAL